jgi:NTP pyrophosphatase (non-canonical NTP hydrolase)
MELTEYQNAAKETDLTKGTSPEGLIIAILGLVSEAGSIANVAKKNLRDNISNDTQKEFLAIELGDVLWYLSNVATRLGLSLDEIARGNLARTRSRHGTEGKWTDAAVTKSFEDDFLETEKFPRRMVFRFEETKQGRTLVTVSLLKASPNVFPTGALTNSTSGKRIGFSLGAPLTDNSDKEDEYRYHDIFHIGFMTVLGWSPVLRDLMRLKRKSNPDVDENQDGQRACDAEEGISTYLAKRSEKFEFFATPRNVDNATIDTVLEPIRDYEVAERPAWLWKEAISRAFVVWKQLSENHGGYVIADLNERSLTYSAVLPD